ncbi:MAG: SDR family oxidoreductase [Phenylobacterium sp.]|uniref:SDR family oxidoreductase n=1 Tax=Phenylobacterium sp. TaxID=1871053 RepID=UPI001A483D9A|nr:SDR family oxidoreductase [Phenylobacterium sp.]MBL8553295.1 SDR family oxidoreductase [Phenylobacterium sp.]
MRVFVTGATGFVGAAVTAELIGAGHTVLGLTRSDAGAAALAAAGAEAHRGSLANAASLTAGAAAADGVIHLAFNHDFSTYMQNCDDDRRAIAALAAGLAGTAKPLLVTSGTGMGAARPGQMIGEDDPAASATAIPRAASEEAAQAAAAEGANAGVVRLPQVHDTEKQGLVSPYIQAAIARGFCAYVGEGANRWAAAHVGDVARLYRLALERGTRGARWHAVGEEGVTLRAIAETLGKRLGLPVRSIDQGEAADYFGWLAMFAGHDAPASSALTQARLGWRPTGPGLLEDLADLKLPAS